MAFVFSLAAVATVRRERERQAERALAAVLREIQRTQATLARLETELREMAAARLAAASRQLTGVSLHEQYARMELLRTARGEVVAHLGALTAQREQQQLLYIAAHRDRDLLNELEQRQRAIFQGEQALREQKRNDDLFLARRLRR